MLLHMFTPSSLFRFFSKCSCALTLCLAAQLYAQDIQESNDNKNIAETTAAANHKEFIKNLTEPEISEIIEVLQTQKNETFAIISNLGLNVGEHGIIMRDLESYQSIIGGIEVLEILDSKAKVKIFPFHQLYQPYLPTPRLTPQIGDKVIFRSFNNKAFIIAPNEESYQAVALEYPFINFINSDLLMGFLNSQGKHDPTIKTLPRACNEYGVGLVFIVGSKNIGVLGCQNLTPLLKYENTPQNAEVTQSPFYTRIYFEGGGSLTYSLSSKKSKEYYKYYDTMLGDFEATTK